MNEQQERMQDHVKEAEGPMITITYDTWRAAYLSWKALQILQGKVSREDFRLALADVALKKCHELFAEREARLFGEEVQP